MQEQSLCCNTPHKHVKQQLYMEKEWENLTRLHQLNFIVERLENPTSPGHVPQNHVTRTDIFWGFNAYIFICLFNPLQILVPRV